MVKLEDIFPSWASGLITVFEVSIENVSKLKNDVFSEPFIMRNLPWRIMVLPRLETGVDKTVLKSIGIFLQCNGDPESSSWSVVAAADIKILKHNGDEPLIEGFNHTFCSKENDCGHFFRWSNISDPSKGYIKDDKLVFEVHVFAGKPRGFESGTPAVVRLSVKPDPPTLKTNPQLTPLGLPAASLLSHSNEVTTFKEHRGSYVETDFEASAPIYASFKEVAAALAKPSAAKRFRSS